MPSRKPAPPKVFISYSHESPNHMDRVLQLSDRLRAGGVDCRIDQYEDSPREGWPRWMVNRIEGADFVLVACTETYERRFKGRERRGKGRGAKWEGAIVTQALYDAEAKNKKFLPIVFSPSDTDHIPAALRGATYYGLDTEEGYEKLYRRITNQPAVTKPKLGTIQAMPERKRKQDFFPPRESAGRKSAAERALLNRYLREVWGDCVRLKLTTIDRKTAGGREAAELDLAAVFTDLDVAESAEPDRKGMRARVPSRLEASPEERGRLPVMAAITRHPRLVLLGDPGSGKSTLVNFLALCLAGEGLGEDSANPGKLGKVWKLPRPIPIRVLLRDYAARGLPEGKSLWQFFRDEMTAVKTSDGDLSGCLPAIEKALTRPAGALLLLDGVDEVPEANRRRVDLHTAIEAFTRDFPHCRILATSRPYAYQDPQARLSEFEVRTLMEFTPEQIKGFIGRWYAHVGEKDRALGRANAERYAVQLQRVIDGQPRIAELARRPLLLTLMASLHRWREGGNLPEKRQTLYEESVQLLIDLWQREMTLFDLQGRPIGKKEYDVFTELGIRQEKLREAVNLLAFEAHRDQPVLTGTNDIPASQLVGALSNASDDKGKAQGEQRIVRYVANRAGLLVERAQGLEMAGNVWEWTASVFKPYPYRRQDDDGWKTRRTDSRSRRTIRGGSWNNPQDLARCSYRLVLHPGFRDGLPGFRCCSRSPGAVGS